MKQIYSLFNDETTSNVIPKQNFSSMFEDEWISGVSKYKNEFLSFKPILRIAFQNVIYIFIINTFIYYIFNLIRGGTFIQSIMAIPNIRSIDSNRSLGITLICLVFAIVSSSSVIGLIIFNQEEITIIFVWLLNLSEKPIDPKQIHNAKRIFIITTIQFFTYLIESFALILILYVVKIFERQIRLLNMSISHKSVILDSAKLYRLKTQLKVLSEHFNRIMKVFFFIPITFISFGNIYLMISAACYLMFGENRVISPFMLNYGLFAIIRVFVLCCSGNLVINAHRDLLQQTFEHIPEWSLTIWSCFNEIKRLGEHFKVNIFNTYTIQQSAILSILAFTLNYIVILLQTENFANIN